MRLTIEFSYIKSFNRETEKDKYRTEIEVHYFHFLSFVCVLTLSDGEQDKRKKLEADSHVG